MSDTQIDRPSIAELLDELTRMTPGRWSADGEYGSIHVDGEAAGISSMGNRSDAIGIASLRNVAPVLLEIVAAALAYIESDDEDRADEVDRLIAALSKVRP